MSWVEFQVFLGQGLEDLSTFKSGWVKAAILTSTFFNLGYFQVQKDQLFSSQLKEKLKKLELYEMGIFCSFYEVNFKSFFVNWNIIQKRYFGKIEISSLKKIFEKV